MISDPLKTKPVPARPQTRREQFMEVAARIAAKYAASQKTNTDNARLGAETVTQTNSTMDSDSVESVK